MKKLLSIFWILLMVFLCACQAGLSGYIDAPPSVAFDGQTEVNAGQRHFLLQEAPENVAEKLVADRYLYDITGQSTERASLYGEGSALHSALENENSQAPEGFYRDEYIVHRLETLSKDQAAALSPVFWEHVTRDVKKCGLTAYTIVLADVSKTWNQAAHAYGPQIGDGRFERLYLCGIHPQSDVWHIYELYWGEYFQG